MSGENGQAAPAAEAVQLAADATTNASAEAFKEAVAAKTEDAVDTAPVPTESNEKSDKAAQEPGEKQAEQAEEKADVEMTDAAAPAESAAQATEAADETAAQDQADQSQEVAGADADKSKGKRKSIGGGGSKGKKLNKKASKPRILHLDAQPGDHYFVKLKGFPQWPVIICDEDMLPASLLKSRPVTAKRADGTYREDYADGGKNVADRTFPVMYLHTNEFGWVPNSDLIELDPSTVLEGARLDKMRKPLQAAYELASKNHSLSFYKEVLQNFQEDLIQQEKAKAAKAATPKGKKSKAVEEDEEDVEMADAPDSDETPAKDKKAKKRKAEESAETPQRSDSVKKPKIKLTTSSTPKTANGAASTPKSTKAAKPKAKKTKEADEKVVEKEVVTPKEPELSPEDRHARKEKEVLFLRHKLQKGLLTRDQEPKEEEMKSMADYITKLEGFPDLEVSIIRATKINKVLKAILKLENIPKEEEFHFKPRSQALLDKWNKLLAVDGTPAPAAEGANAVNGTAAKAGAKTNGVKEKSEGAEPAKAKGGAKEEAKEDAEEAAKAEPKEAAKEASKPAETSEEAEKPVTEEAKESEAVGASA